MLLESDSREVPKPRTGLMGGSLHIIIQRIYPLKLCLPKFEHASVSLDLCVENQIHFQIPLRPKKSKLQGNTRTLTQLQL